MLFSNVDTVFQRIRCLIIFLASNLHFDRTFNKIGLTSANWISPESQCAISIHDLIYEVLRFASHYRVIAVYVVVQFYLWFNFDFVLFFSMLLYDNEYKTKENQN